MAIKHPSKVLLMSFIFKFVFHGASRTSRLLSVEITSYLHVKKNIFVCVKGSTETS